MTPLKKRMAIEKNPKMTPADYIARLINERFTNPIAMNDKCVPELVITDEKIKMEMHWKAKMEVLGRMACDAGWAVHINWEVTRIWPTNNDKGSFVDGRD